MAKYYVGDTPLLRVDCVNDISDAAASRILYWKPDGVSGHFNSSAYTSTVLQYQITDATVLDMPGAWKFAGFVALAGGLEYTGEVFEQQIHKRGR